ncbi:MAG: rod shape-determining protein RodA [Deltaproteobacteria bacterium HGW-Deltaproteobacteria-12]|jgi:rod shape determining protein RodA|nr:MAG: rod shape-determining protein RodA [Deltaproteobacteria bacterium HGW-Deltaproteobacteria-12]
MVFFKFDRRIFQYFDWTLLLLVLCICAVGIINIYSAVFSLGEKQNPLYLKQIQWVAMGAFFMMIVFLIDYRIISDGAYIIYGISVALLVAVFLYGYTTNGSQRWISIGGFSGQPSELVKLTIILALARYFDDHKSNEPYTLKELFIPSLMVLAPFLLILKQPDLGTALILIIVFASLVVFIGVNWKSVAIVAAGVIMLMPLGWYFLKDYQRDRLITFINPENDPLGTGYHIIQSMIAVGSGGIFGKGFLKGSQTQLKFLPEQQTDFVFSVFAEEWGFIGGLFLIILFMSLIFWGLKIALHSRDLLGTLIAFGISALISWEVFINIGMVLGILPVVGIPLPFFSYGGSAMIVLMTAIGLLMNVSVRRFILQR